MRTRIIALALFFAFSLNLSAQGFDENYVVYQGDLNSDGRTDLYIKQKPQIVILHGDIATPIVIPPDVTDFILEQNIDDETFTLIPNPTSSQIATVSGWSESIVEVITGDFNIDGVIDILLNDIDLISGASSAFNQIIFGDTNNAQSPPMHVRAMDNDFQQFFAELDHSIYDPDYFQNYAPLTPQLVTVNEMQFRPEYCASQAWVNQNGPLSNLPTIPTIIKDTEDDLDDHFVEFLLFCASTGRDVVHYDLVSVQFQETQNLPDTSVFNQDAMIISETINDVIEDGELPEGSQEKNDIEVTLEDYMEVEVFGDTMNDDDERDILFPNIKFLAQLVNDINDPNSVEDCPPIDPTLYNAGYNFHKPKFLKNNVINVNVTNNSSTDSTVNISFTLGRNSGVKLQYFNTVLDGIHNYWDGVCRTTPSGDTIHLEVSVTSSQLFPQVTLSNQDELEEDGSCRDEAILGGNEMTICQDFIDEDNFTSFFNNIPYMESVAAHEFGHIIGFDDAYDDVTGDVLGGLINDIMGPALSEILAYHLFILKEEYE